MLPRGRHLYFPSRARLVVAFDCVHLATAGGIQSGLAACFAEAAKRPLRVAIAATAIAPPAIAPAALMLAIVITTFFRTGVPLIPIRDYSHANL